MANIKKTVELAIETSGQASIQSLVDELNDLAKSGAEAAPEAQRLAGALRELESRQQLVNSFRALKTSTQDAAQALADAQTRAQALARELAATESPSRKLNAEFERARKAVNAAEQALIDEHQALNTTRRQLAETGISTQNLATAQTRLKQEVAATATGARVFAHNLKTADAAATQAGASGRGAFDSTRESASRLNDQLGTVRNTVAGVFAASQLSEWAQDTAKAADAWNGLNARLKLATTSAEEYATAQQAVFEIAQRTQSDLAATANLYGRVAKSVRELGGSQADTLALTEEINQTMRISGATTESAAAGIQQLSQALQSGVLRGDEFNSVMENSPRLAQALADGLGVPIGQLRAMAEQGELTAQKVITALQSQRQAIEKEFGQMPQTIGGAVQKLSNEWLKFVGEMDQANAASQKVVGGLNAVAGHLNEIATLAVIAGEAALAALAVKGVKSALDFAGSLATATKEARAMGSVLSRIPTSLQIAVAVVGFEALKAAAEYAAELAAKHSEAAHEAAAAEERLRQVSESALPALQARANALSQFRDLAIQNTDAINRMGDAERQRYSESLAAATRYHQAEITALNVRAQIGETVKEDMAAEQAALAKIAAAQTAVTAANQRAAEALRAGVTPAALALADAFETAQRAGKTSAEAIDTAFGDLSEKLRSADGVIATLGGFQALSDRGKLSAQEIEQALSGALSKLTAEDLPRFQAAATYAFETGKLKAEQMAGALDQSLSEALKRLGVDSNKLATGISSDFAGTLQTFRAVGENARASSAQIVAAYQSAAQKAGDPTEYLKLNEALKQQASQGRITGQTLAAAFASTAKGGLDQFYAALEKADSVQSLNALRDQLQQMGNSGVIASNQVQESLADLNKRMEEVRATTGMTRQEAEAWKKAHTEAAQAATESTTQELAAQAELAKAYAERANTLQSLRGDMVSLRDQANQSSGDYARLDQQAADLGQRLKTAFEQGIISSTEYRNALMELESATDSFARHTQELGNAAANIFNNITNEVYGLSRAAGDAYANQVGLATQATDALGQMEAGLKRVQDTLNHNNSLVGNLDYFGLNETYNKALLVEKSFYEQSIAAEKLRAQIVQMTAEGNPRLAEMVEHADNALRSFNLMDEQQLSGLRSAVGDARNSLVRMANDAAAAQDRLMGKLDQVRDRLRGVTDSLQDELDRMNGNDVAIENRDYARRRSELDQLKTDAGSDPAALSEYQQALQTLEAIHAKRLAEIEARAKTQTPTTSTPTSASTTASTPARTVRVELAMGGKTVSATIDASQEDDLLALLEKAKARAN